MRHAVSTAVAVPVAIGLFLAGIVAGKSLPDLEDSGFVATQTHPHRVALDGGPLTVASLAAGETRGITREEAAKHCSHVCAHGYLPSGRGIALPQEMRP